MMKLYPATHHLKRMMQLFCITNLVKMYVYLHAKAPQHAYACIKSMVRETTTTIISAHIIANHNHCFHYITTPPFTTTYIAIVWNLCPRNCNYFDSDTFLLESTPPTKRIASHARILPTTNFETIFMIAFVIIILQCNRI